MDVRTTAFLLDGRNRNDDTRSNAPAAPSPLRSTLRLARLAPPAATSFPVAAARHVPLADIQGRFGPSYENTQPIDAPASPTNRRTK